MRQKAECHPQSPRKCISKRKHVTFASPAEERYDYGMSFSEMAFLFLLGLILFGPKKLPELSRQLGRLLGELRRASQEFKSQLTEEVSNLDKEGQISSSIGSLQVAGTSARERIFNAVKDVGNTITGNVEGKILPPTTVNEPAMATKAQETQASSAISVAETPSNADAVKETIH